MLMWVKRGVAAILVAVLLAGCGTALKQPVQMVAATEESLEQEYEKALEVARTPVAANIRTDLVALTSDTPELVWNDQGEVLMVSWTYADYYKDYEPGDSFPLYGDTWLTAAPFMKEFCTAYSGEDLQLRLAQNLGMPPGRTYDTFVELWVPLEAIFRPCPDPEISDRECMVRIPLKEGSFESEPDQPPWDCEQGDNQLSSAYVVVNPNHLVWMCTNWTKSFTNEQVYDNYPWTALGYTYDWGSPDIQGQSEFIAPKSTEVRLHSKTSTKAYCGR